MANDITKVIPKLLAQGLLALRANSVMPRLVNRNFSGLAARKGDTIDVPIPSDVTVSDVTAGVDGSGQTDLSPTTVPIRLENWKQASFLLTDKEIQEAMEGIIPMQASAAVSALADYVDTDILNAYKWSTTHIGTIGTTPFGSDVNIALEAGKELTGKKAPKSDRRFILDTGAEFNALKLTPFQYVNQSGSTEGIRDAEINRKLGFDFYTSQNVPTYTVGKPVNFRSDGSFSIGATDIHIDKGTAGTGAATEGDLFTFSAGGGVTSGPYSVVKITSGPTGAQKDTDIRISPALTHALPDNYVLTFTLGTTAGDTSPQNLAFHRDAIAFVTRPMGDVGFSSGSIFQTEVDPVSGLVLRLEVTREFKQTRFCFDILYGVGVLRPEHVIRVLG